jgi:hypothetical protein
MRVLLTFLSEYVKGKSVCSSRVLYEGDDLRLADCVCYTWEMALNVGIDVSCCKIQYMTAKGNVRMQETLIAEKAYVLVTNK